MLTIIWLAFFIAFGETSKVTEVDILILGAGITGITAGQHFQSKNLTNFLILEAQDYIGGRIKQASISNITVGIGANWIHFVEDGKNNPILQLAKKINLQTYLNNESDIFVRSTTYDRHDYEETDRRFKEIQLKVTKKYKDKVRNQDEPLMSALSANGWIADTPLKRTVEWMFHDYEYAIKTSLISTRHFSGEAGTNAIITDSRGFRGIIDHLAQNFTEKIKTNTVVVQINYTSSGVEILTQTNHKYRAKYALCTFSTGVLASDLVKFTPKLPQWKKEAISRLPLAFYCNIYVKFPYSFWENQEFIINPASISETFPVLYNLNKKKIHNGSNILLFTAVEDNALRVETQSREETIVEIMKTLGKMYPNVSLPQPQEISIGRLSQNPYIRGSFSNSVVGSTTADNHNLQGRLDNLFFAGEATDENYWGYTQGGYLSGLKQAKAIYNCMTSKNCPKYTPEYRNNYGQRLQCKREFIISLFVSIVFCFFHA